MANGTRERIITAFFRLAAKFPDKMSFSITEIADEAGLSRQAIYKNHFNSPEEIIDYIHTSVDRKISNLLSDSPKNTEHSLHYFAEYIIPILYEKRTWLKYLYSTLADPVWRHFLTTKYRNWVLDNLELNLKDVKISKMQVATLFVNNILSIIEIWITEEIPATPHDFKHTFLELCEISISDYYKG